ncbi:MAG: glycosyltransferase family 4 protein [Bacteroidota bacterium]
MRILILYMELAGYVMACLKALASIPGVEVLLICWPVNQEAPFKFEQEEAMRKIERNSQPEKDLWEEIQAFSPDLVFVSGWVDKWYTKVAKAFLQQGIPTVVGADNQWINSPKQHLASWLSPILLKPSFSHFWVPGPRQYAFASRLGYKAHQIRTGYYSADVPVFMEQGLTRSTTPTFPKRLLYVGRLVKEKGVQHLLTAFRQLPTSDWELWLAGTGPLEAEAEKIPKVNCLGFVQPGNLPEVLSSCGAGILPSIKEPWGVVLHEYVASGLPVLVSDSCGAGESFLRAGYNGLAFRAGEIGSLQTALEKLFSLSDEELILMGKRSRELAKQITPDSWAATLLSVLESQ